MTVAVENNAQPEVRERSVDPLVVDLFAQLATDVRRVGGKAAPLARAAAAGFRVPEGIVVVPSALERGPDELRRAIEDRLDELGPGPFAVRSSAIVEDGNARSFAGQLETRLGVPRDGVVEAVARCASSAQALRAIRYAGGEVGPIAVIVQRMVPADCAGVAFSADPRTGERDVAIVEAVRGLGDRLVSGHADPESWRVDGSRCARTRAGEGPALDEGRARRVASLVRDLEALSGRPQDVEWAFAGDELFVLQSRPITALPAAPVPIPVEVPEGDWDRDDHHGVLSPLGWAWFQPYPKAMAACFREIGMPIEAMEVKRIGGHLYMRMVMGGGDKVPPRWVLWLAARLLPPLRRANRLAKELLDRETYMLDLERWESEWRPAMRRRISELHVDDPSSLSDEALLRRIDDALALSARGLEHHARLGGPGLFSFGKLLLFVEDHLGWSAERALDLVTGSSAATTEVHRTLERIVRAHEDELAAASASDCETPRTWAALLDRCPRLGRALSAWLEENALRMLHYDPKHPTYGERPDVVLAVIDAIVANGPAAPSDRAREIEAEALREATERLGPDRLAEFRRLLEQARRTHGLRDENGIDTVSKPAGLLRRFVLELGRRIEPAIGAREHAVYLYPEEHRPALRGELRDVSALVERRRGEESWALRNRGPRRYGGPRAPMPPVDAFPDGLARVMRIMAWMERAEATPGDDSSDDLLRGVGVGARVVTARARVLDRPEDLAQLRPGEVVVCRITSPEWSMGLGRMAAIVTNEGGQLSHPAIIAREYGIPAVLGTERATRAIATGDIVRVDPIAGTVQIVRA